MKKWIQEKINDFIDHVSLSRSVKCFHKSISKRDKQVFLSTADVTKKTWLNRKREHFVRFFLETWKTVYRFFFRFEVKVTSHVVVRLLQSWSFDLKLRKNVWIDVENDSCRPNRSFDNLQSNETEKACFLSIRRKRHFLFDIFSTHQHFHGNKRRIPTKHKEKTQRPIEVS